MIRAVKLLGGVLVFGAAFWSGAAPSSNSGVIDGEPTGPKAGLALAAELRNMRLENGEWKGDLKIQRHGRDGRTTTTIPLAGQSAGDKADGARWAVSYLAGGAGTNVAEALTVIHSTNGPNQYLYARAAAAGEAPGEPAKLEPARAEIPLAGSDFWLTDLGFDFYHWPEQNRLKGAMRSGRPCYVLESTNPAAKPGGYWRIVSWIDRESGAPIEAEAYGSDQKLLKEFELGHVKKVDGRYELKDMSISNVRTGSKTTLEFDLPVK